jgi:hypothetical protein
VWLGTSPISGSTPLQIIFCERDWGVYLVMM